MNKIVATFLVVIMFGTPVLTFANNGNPPTCDNIKTMTGWYGSYYDYSATHPDMEEVTETWSSTHGDPLSVNATWTTDWYDASYFRSSRVDANLEFGGAFFPMDIVPDGEITNGHNYHFGASWFAKVTASSTGDYAYTLTSDDDAWVYVDGVLVVDNSLVHAPVTKTGAVYLTEGVHIVKIFFAERHTVQSYMSFNFTDDSLIIRPYNPSCAIDPVNPPVTPINTPPAITLIGNNPFTVATDTPFIDPGATANDTEDGNITTNIVITGSVNASTTGSYILTYSVTDSGSLSTSTTRTVIINATPVVVPPTDTPTNNGAPSTGSGSSSGGGGGIGGRRHDISNLITSGTVLGVSTECSYLRDYLRIDLNNDKIEVLKLQSFLNVYEKENLPYDGVFGESTLEAVNRFQDKYKSDILTPWGHTAPTGYVYILTKKKINEIYCNTLLSLSNADQNEINNFRAYLQSLNAGGTDTPLIDLSDYVGLNTDGSIKSTSTIGSIAVKTQDGLKNLAISLLGMPKNLGHVSSTYLLIIIAIVLIITYAVKSGSESKPESIIVLGESKKEDNKNEKFKGLITENDSDKDDDTNGPSSNNSSGTGFKGIIG